MSLRTRTSSLPEVSKPSIRSRIPIARIPQPREDRMPSTCGSPSRGVSLRRCEHPKRRTPAAGSSQAPAVTSAARSR